MDNKSTFIKQDSLLKSLVLYTKLYHKPYSAEALMFGLPVHTSEEGERLFTIGGSKSLFSRAAEHAGLKSILIQRPINQMLELQLPVILLLRNDYTCILDSFSEDRTQAKIIYPDGDGGETWVSVEELESEYLGFAFMLKKKFQYNSKKTRTLQLKQKHWFWSTLNISRVIYSDVLWASFLINVFVLATPLFTMNVYDRVIPNNAKETLMVFTIGIVVVYLVDFFLKFIRSYMLELAGKKSDIIMSSIIFEKVLDLKMAAHPASVGSFADRLKNFESVRSFFTTATMSAVIDLPFTVIFMLVIFYIGGILVVIPITTMLLIILYAAFVKRPLRESIETSHDAGAKKNSILIQTLQNIDTVKAMSMSGKLQWEWEESIGEMAEKNIKARLLSSSISNVTRLLLNLNTVAVIVTGVFMIKEFELTMGGLIAVYILTSRAVAPIGRVAALVSNFEDAKNAYITINEIISGPSERPYDNEFLQRPNITGTIEFKDVTFTYPGASLPSLNKVSFTIKAGEKVAILGKTGSGKSTLLKLILKLYEPEDGSILIDGIDISQIDPADLRRSMGYVPQDVQLFSGTLKDNIVSSERYPSDDEIIHAAVISGVADFAHTHPHGYEMQVGERGAGLSGGQRQGVGIARALLGDTKIMLMDEPTNAIDQNAEAKLIKNLKVELKEETLILVTHKLQLLELVDRVIVMDHYKVALDGPKDEVMKKLSGASDV